MPLGRASIASGYTALVASGDRLALTEPAGENGRTPQPPAGGVLKGKVKGVMQKKGQKGEPHEKENCHPYRTADPS